MPYARKVKMDTNVKASIPLMKWPTISKVHEALKILAPSDSSGFITLGKKYSAKEDYYYYYCY